MWKRSYLRIRSCWRPLTFDVRYCQFLVVLIWSTRQQVQDKIVATKLKTADFARCCVTTGNKWWRIMGSIVMIYAVDLVDELSRSKTRDNELNYEFMSKGPRACKSFLFWSGRTKFAVATFRVFSFLENPSISQSIYGREKAFKPAVWAHCRTTESQLNWCM